MKNDVGLGMPRRRILATGAAAAAIIRTAGRSGPVQAQPAAAQMLTRAIPRTGETLPVIGLGTARGWGSANDDRGARAAVVRALIAGGGRIIDTAPSYGEAERLVGDLVAASGARQSVFLATKLEDYSRSSGPADLRSSQQRLRSGKIDLMQLHNVSDRRQDLGMMRDWKAQGVCRYIGITTTYHGDFDAAEAVLRREKPDFLEIDYSIEDREAEKRLIPAAADLGVALLTAEPLGRGRLFRAVQQKPLPDWAREFGAATWAQFFIKYLLGHPAVTAVIPGTANPAHMEDNLAAGHGRVPDAAERQKMIEVFASLG